MLAYFRVDPWQHTWDQNSKTRIEGNAFQNTVYKMRTILLRSWFIRKKNLWNPHETANKAEVDVNKDVTNRKARYVQPKLAAAYKHPIVCNAPPNGVSAMGLKLNAPAGYYWFVEITSDNFVTRNRVFSDSNSFKLIFSVSKTPLTRYWNSPRYLSKRSILTYDKTKAIS